ncbi:tRNA preQ1(34) S-adenosylmethionine ribosyltransferase-isomerase QueA [Candidatus Saccharibacteria bacterium]|nr:tRNA preQ1(34) S-adenosylmethionine ribosyltransferase-isomerase QueA [Candidatus Saccharibacteria bacterium]
MKLSDYSYELPPSLIADMPPDIRGSSRLLVLDSTDGSICDESYLDVVEYMRSGDVLVLNDTKVIKARLRTHRGDGSERELIVLERHSFDDDWHEHRVLYRRKLSVGEVLTVGDAKLEIKELLGDGLAIVQSDRNLLDLADEIGEVPLPPYMNREAIPLDVERYQTVWANEKGSVAAPTASLNMTDRIIDGLRKKGVQVVYLTLHVGLGTFLPIRVDDIEDHKMHKEYFVVPESTIKSIWHAKREGHKVFALGTTVARTLEYVADQLDKDAADLSGEADIFIYPGYHFKVVDGLLTNFHAPKSTVLMLASAFAGWDNLLPAYQHAIKQGYRFLSYGDSMLIL